MKRLSLYFLLAAVAASISGCRSGGENTGSVPADRLAQSDPNGKAKAILDQLAALPAEERTGWVQRRSGELVVFQAVTDPQLRARYDAEIAPLLTGQ